MTDVIAGVELARVWEGINHVTLVTGDLDATVAFYRDLLEMRVVFEGPANPHHGRHAMISPGGPGMGLHFFEVAGAQIFRLSDGVPSKPEFIPGALQHIAIGVANETAALALRERLSARGVPMTPVLEPGRLAPMIRVFLFTDPSGLLLKATWLRAEDAHRQ
jgi:catechol 2,3-dioxygenase-like lactoylglutathione lyase family enzyme